MQERLHKFLAHCGVASRRKCEELILEGRVKINGVVVDELGVKIDPEKDRILVDNKPTAAEKKVYYLLHKPKGFTTTSEDELGRRTVLDLLEADVPERVYSAGRLDRDSEGLLVLTNDGDLSFFLTHPSKGVRKVYDATVEGEVSDKVVEEVLRDGVRLGPVLVRPQTMKILHRQSEKTVLRVSVSEGVNREVRRLFAALGHEVKRLVRIEIGPFSLREIPRGKYRRFSRKELQTITEWMERGGSGDAAEVAIKLRGRRTGRPTGKPDPATATPRRSKAEKVGGVGAPGKSGRPARGGKPAGKPFAARATATRAPRSTTAAFDDDADSPRSRQEDTRPGAVRAGGYKKREGDERKPRAEYPKREGGFKKSGDYADRKPSGAAREGGYKKREGGDRKPRAEYQKREGGFKKSGDYADRKPSGAAREGGYKKREDGDHKPRAEYPKREGGFKKSGDYADRKPSGAAREGGYKKREGDDRKPRAEYPKREGGFKKSSDFADRKPSGAAREGGYKKREGDERKPRAEYPKREGGFKKSGGFAERKPSGAAREGGFKKSGDFSDRKPSGAAREGGYKKRGGDDRKPSAAPSASGYKKREGSFIKREDGGQKRSEFGDRKPSGAAREGGYKKRESDDRKPRAEYQKREGGFKKSGGFADRKPSAKQRVKPTGSKKKSGGKSGGSAGPIKHPLA